MERFLCFFQSALALTHPVVLTRSDARARLHYQNARSVVIEVVQSCCRASIAGTLTFCQTIDRCGAAPFLRIRFPRQHSWYSQRSIAKPGSAGARRFLWAVIGETLKRPLDMSQEIFHLSGGRFIRVRLLGFASQRQGTRIGLFYPLQGTGACAGFTRARSGLSTLL